jgi:hypothetical protein
MARWMLVAPNVITWGFVAGSEFGVRWAPVPKKEGPAPGLSEGIE